MAYEYRVEMDRILAILRGPAGLASAWLSEALMPDWSYLFRSGFRAQRDSVPTHGARDRYRQVGVRFTEVALQSRKSDDLAFVGDGACGLQVQSSVLRNESIHVDCGSVAPQDGPRVEARVERDSKHHAVVADSDGQAVGVTGQSSKVADVPRLPEKGMKALVALGVGDPTTCP
jgi:hypothetical protein